MLKPCLSLIAACFPFAVQNAVPLKKTLFLEQLHHGQKRFVDVETGDHVNLYADNIKETYEEAVQKYFTDLKLKCGLYRIKYVPTDINESFNKILTTYLVERQKFG